MTSKQKEQFNKDLIKKLKAHGFEAIEKGGRSQLDLETGGFKIQVLTWACAYNCLHIEGIEEPISTEGNLTFAQIKQQVESFTELTLEKPKKYDWDSCIERLDDVYYIDLDSEAQEVDTIIHSTSEYYNSLPTEKACNQLNAFTRLMIVVHALNEDFESDGGACYPNIDSEGVVYPNSFKCNPFGLHSRDAYNAFVSEPSNIDLLKEYLGF